MWELCTCACAFKIEMCELTAERHRLQEQLRSATEQQQRASSSLQQRITTLLQERDAVQVLTQVHDTQHLNFYRNVTIWHTHNHTQQVFIILFNPKYNHESKHNQFSFLKQTLI